MSTSTPTTVAFGDIQQVTLVNFQSTVYSVCLRAGSQISYHRDGDLPEVFTNLPFGGFKDKIGAVVTGDILNLVWSSGGSVNFARWNLLTETIDSGPTPVFDGRGPDIDFGQGKLIVHYISSTGNHDSRFSSDNGVTWTSPVTVDTKVSTDIEHVDISVSPDDDVTASWANSKAAT